MVKNKRTLLVVSIGYLAMTQITFAAPSVYVDANYSSKNSDNHTYGVDAFSTIQEGVNAVNEDGIVYVKRGIYNESITIGKSLAITGLAEQSIVGAASDSPMIDGGYAVGTITVSGTDTPINVSIYDMRISHGNHGILVIQDAKVLITNNTIENYRKNGITFGSKIIRGAGNISGMISSNVVKGIGPTETLSQNGIQVAENNTATITANVISDNVYRLPGTKWATGIFIHNSTGVVASKNILINNQSGINILQANGNTLEDNTILGNTHTDAGIMVTNLDDKTRSATKNIVNHNTITGGYTGIWSSYVAGNRYTNNILSNSTQYGIYFWDSDTNTVSNNIISSIHADGRGGYGIALNGGNTKTTTLGSDYNFISNNTVTDSDSKFYTSNNSEKNVVARNNF